MTTTTAPRCILFGQLRREFFILPEGRTNLDVPGGNLIYAAAGFVIWEKDPPPGLVARVGEDYPSSWLETFGQRGLDTRGIKVLPQTVDLRSFYVYADRTNRVIEDPVASFARLGQPFPRELLGYRYPKSTIDSRVNLSLTSLRQSDIPVDYLDASAAHLCPVDYLTHILVPAVLRQAGFNTITLDPSPGTMTPIFWDDMPVLVNGLTAFLPSEEELRALFHGRSSDLWEMVETMASYGCEIVVVKRGERGQILYDAGSHGRWEIPAYPARLANPTGAGDAFCGGFLAGYRQAYDPLMAALYGNIASSLVVEGNGPFFALDALPGLSQARLEALRDTVRKV